MKRQSAITNEFTIQHLYDVAEVEQGCIYWFSKLLNLTLSIFKYDNLPKTLPQREIELQLQLSGHCDIFIKNNKLYTTYTSLYDFDEYYQPTNLVYAQPILGSENLKIDSFDNIVIYNSSLKDNIMGLYIDNSLRTFLLRYSRMLADIESTINIKCVNGRITNIPVAKSDKVALSLRKFFNAFKLGKHEIVSDDKIIESFTDISIPQNSSNETLKDLLESRDKILEQFYRDIGVKFRNNKQAQMNVSEVESDEQVLLISLDDMIECRKKGIEKLNDKFGLNVSVKISDKFNRENFNVEILKGSDNNETERN